MVQFQIRDTITLCASVWDFCGQLGNNLYYIGDINVAVGTCNINIKTPECLSLSGVQLEFQWVNSRNSTQAHDCPDTTKLRVLGSGYSNAQGVVSITWDIDQTDLDLYNTNPDSFELRVCIKNKTIQEIINFGEARNNFRLDYITIVDPCAGVICSNACVGLDLYSQTCSNGACITGTLIEANSSICGAIEETHYLYFKVPELYPPSYVISGISSIFEAATNAISGYTNYYVYGVDFDQADYTITVTIKKTLGLGTMGLRGTGSDVRIHTMIAPIIFALALIAIFIITAIANWYYFWYMGPKSITGEPVSTRIITIVPKICTGDAGTGTLNCINPTPPTIITLEHCIGKICTTTEITDGNPITISAPTDSGITIIGRVKDNPFYTVIKKLIDKGITNETVTLQFMAKDDATLTPKATDAITGNPINGSYIIYEETIDGHMVEVQRGSLDANGKVAPPYKAKAGVYTCTIIIPVDITVHKTQMDCITPVAGDNLTPVIPIKTCSEAKNHISVRTVYITTDGSRLGYTADSIQIKVGTNVIKTIIPTTDITYIDGLDKNTNYIVHIIKAGYTLLNNDQPVSFTTDCDDTRSLMVEANTPVGARDITVEVRNAVAPNALIQGANVFLDTIPARKTDVTGTVSFMAIIDGSHNLKITLEGYKDNISQINVSSTSTSFSKTLTVDQVNATVDTRIYGFTNVGDAIATKPIKFNGSLHYLDMSVSPATYKPLQDATVIVNVKDTSNNILKTFTVVTKNGLLDSGVFETGEWLISGILTHAEITIEAIFEGVGRYKPSSSSTSYVVAAADSCIFPLPWGGCLISKETGMEILMIGGLMVGGIMIFSMAGPMVSKKIIKQ
jgi:hypothetical protein